MTAIGHEFAALVEKLADPSRRDDAAAAALARRTVVVRWGLAPDALASALAGAPNPGVGEGARWVLEWRLDPHGGAAVALCAFVGAEGSEREFHRVELLPRAQRARWVRDDVPAMEHADIPGLLSLTFRVDSPRNGQPPRAELLLARTTLLARIGVPGGQSDRPAAAVE